MIPNVDTQIVMPRELPSYVPVQALQCIVITDRKGNILRHSITAIRLHVESVMLCKDYTVLFSSDMQYYQLSDKALFNITCLLMPNKPYRVEHGLYYWQFIAVGNYQYFR